MRGRSVRRCSSGGRKDPFRGATWSTTPTAIPIITFRSGRRSDDGFAGAVRRLCGQHVVRHGAPRHLYRHHFGLLLRLVLGRGARERLRTTATIRCGGIRTARPSDRRRPRPCSIPARRGWKVPHPYVFSAFTQTGPRHSVSSGTTEVSGSFVQGWNFFYDGSSTTYYPGVGYRYDEYGAFFLLAVGVLLDEFARAVRFVRGVDLRTDLGHGLRMLLRSAGLRASGPLPAG